MSNTYVEAFMTKKPKEGLAIAEERLRNAMAFDIELAEYFKERAQIEEIYAKNLKKASTRLYTTNPEILGYFTPVWESLIKELNQIETYHSEMAYRITQEIERPLRTPPSDDYHKLQQYESLLHLSENKNKLSTVKSSIFRKSKSQNNLNSQNEIADYLMLHQNMDEARLVRLKSTVELFEKIQTEQLMKRVEMANETMSSAQLFDVQHDIQDFCNEKGKGLLTLESTDERPPSTLKQRASTVSSQDSHRSTNKFKSIFLKKKKSHSLDSNETEENRYGSYSNMTNEIVTPTENHTVIDSNNNNNSISSPPLVDAEGYSIPTYTNNNFPNMASDISSRHTSDDVDSDITSLKLNQKLQINIKESSVKEEEKEVNETFNKMATMLREHTPTISKRPRGRRESSINRTQTDSSLFAASASSHSLENPRANSMLSTSSNETSTSNPFIQISPINNNTIFAATSSSSINNMYGSTLLNDSPVHSTWSLQPIPEVQQQQQQQQHYLSVFITEKTNLTASNLLSVSGQILISYQGNSQTLFTSKLPIQLPHIDGIRQLTPNPEYVTVEDGIYMLDMKHFQTNEQIACFTYELDSSPLALPIQLSPSWKCVEDVSYLIVKHTKNPLVADPSKLKGTVQVLMGDQPAIQYVQSTPQGLWDVKNRLTWQLGDLLDQYTTTQPDNQQQRLLAKFYTEGKGAPRPIHLQYTHQDTLVSGISVICDAIEIKNLETRVQSDHIVYM
ncbi:uncharacterized protein BX663DRAFT_562718 [Cokeromyces recurvatus]|uniref:uncharacterized protein n=1 Tax=Cokeromyces recurvatus TaxID=90255 RepID=UPI00221E79DA|nr:uncharacterized protein BX663DRAFT_562718 [Cokeromyces recurvatus]KAI7901012.1 hypothetical protein BX663DRAFT_562718 [Cokeromyces recurvatus]